MNVRELKDILDNFEDDQEVVLASNAEGNKISPLASVEGGMYQAITTWHGDLLDTDDGDVPKYASADTVCVMWPTN